MVGIKNRNIVGFFMVAVALLLSTAAVAADGQVNINTATEAELALLPRVGVVVAGRIIEHRETNGDFEAVEDLMLVKGIGERTFELIEPYASVKGETTLTEKVKSTEQSQADSER